MSKTTTPLTSKPVHDSRTLPKLFTSASILYYWKDHKTSASFGADPLPSNLVTESRSLNYFDPPHYTGVFIQIGCRHMRQLLLATDISAMSSTTALPSHPYRSSSSASSSSGHSTDTSSITGYRRSMDTSAPRLVASVEILRCMRCARSVEATSTDDVSSTGMVRIAHNLYYCERCAKMVGYK